MARKLTKKQKGFVNDYIESGNGTQAALKNYDTDDNNTASSIGTENLTKPAILQAIEDALPDELLNRVHLEGLNATREYYNSKGEHKGDVADFNTRAKYLDMAIKRRGLYAADKHDHTVEVIPSDKLKALANKLNT